MIRRVPFLFFLVTVLMAFAASLVLGGWFRQLAHVYGMHANSTVTLLAECFICLSLGCAVFGRIADKVKKPLNLYIILGAVSALYIFLQKPIFDLINELYAGRAQAAGFSNNMLRWSLPFLFMIVPLSFISGMLPLLIRYFIKSINHAGIYVSATLFSISIGIVMAIVISVLFLVPYFGIASLYIAGGTAIIASLAFILIRMLKRNETNVQQAPAPNQTVTHTPIRFKKKRIVLEAGAKLTRAMLYGSVFQAFSFSSFLIIYLRILVKFNHANPVFFYTSVLAIVFSGTAVGSALYRIVADKPANKYLTLAILQIIGGIASLLSFVLLQIMAPSIFESIHETESFAGQIIPQLILNSLLVFIPSVIHGMSFPLAGRLYPKRLQQIGKTFGHLCSFILLSLLAGIIITPLLLIPLIGIHPAFIFLSMIIVMSGIYLIIRDSRLIRGFRLAFAFAAILVFVLIVTTLRMLNISQRNRATDGLFEGSTASVRFISNSNGTKSVYISGDYYFGTSRESIKEQILTASIPAFISRDVQSALVIGFNTGIAASLLNDYKISKIHISEMSPEVIRLSSTAFADENNDILTGARVTINVEDARSYLYRTEESYDLIISGTEQVLLYPGKYTSEFLRICYGKLSDMGMFCQAFPYNRINREAFISFYKTFAAVFNYTSIWYVSPESVLIIGSKTDQTLEYCSLTSYFDRLSGIFRLDSIGISDPESLLAHFILKDDPFGNSGVVKNSDFFPEFEFRYSFRESQTDSMFFLNLYTAPLSSFRVSDTCRMDTAGMAGRIVRISLSLMQRVSPSSDVQPHVDGSSASNGSPFQQYP